MSPWGSQVQSAIFDQVRTCDNHCAFCFIHQLPPGMRSSLSLKDDDYRLSFLYGNFTTLTRFTEADLERVVTDGLGPLYVSIHATDPEVRAEMLRNRRGATSLRWLRALLDHGIVVHGQVVVCPGVNDGAILDDTLCGVLDRFPELETCAVVPLGVSDFNTEPTMRPHTRDEARAVVDVIDGWQETFSATLGRPLVFAADEYYLMADRPFPPVERYGTFELHEDGVGMARSFELEFTGRADRPIGPQAGFFHWVDGAEGEGYRAPRTHDAPARHAGGPVEATPVTLRTPDRRPVGILTGSLGASVLVPLIEDMRSDRCPGAPRGQPVLRRQRRCQRAHGGRGHRPRSRRAARRPSLPAARRLPFRGSIPGRPDAPRTLPSGRGGRNPWDRPSGGPPWVMGTHRSPAARSWPSSAGPTWVNRR